LSLVASLGAQSPLSTLQATYPANSLFVWLGTPSPNLFFNLAVNATTTVTVYGLDVQLDAGASPAGVEGTVEMYLTNAGTTTYAGNETNAGAWTLRATGTCTSAGAMPSRVCFPTGVVLQPGTTYGCAVHFVDQRPVFLLGNSTAVPGGTGAGTNQYYQNADLTLLAGTTQAVAFASGAAASYVWLGAVHYGVGSAPAACAQSTKFGQGCYSTVGSFYQRFANAPAASAALSGKALSLFFTGTGYAAVPATGVVSYIAPTGAAMALPANDDGETAVNLSSMFIYPGGTTNQLFVHTNGYVSVATNNVQTPTNYTPNVLGLLDSPQMAWWSWHDYNAAEAGSGTIKFEEVNSNTMGVITWENVESYPDLNGTTPVVNQSTWQLQFDYTTFQVNYVWQNITAVGGSGFSDETIVGFSPGGPSPNPGPTNLATVVSIALTVPEVFPLTLDASPVALLGNTVAFTTSNEPGVSLGVNFLCLSAVQPGFPLDILGMPGCLAHVDINTGVGNLITNLGAPNPGMTISLPIPNGQPALIGQQLHSQSVWLAAAANPFGAITSNGVSIRIGTF
ncbi:MAG TPA: hypothetical protein VFZ65_13800, partial [Planctomycetota bacterium]|nr:hypothetical protein [Planctomycetota bacterium]